jgi:hypothetical protein
MGSLSRVAATAFATAALGLAVAAPAGAAPTQDQHCAVDLSAGGRVTCYRTFTEAIAKATGGRITDAPRAAAATDADLTRRLNALARTKTPSAAQKADVVWGIEYEHDGYSGSSITSYNSRSCDENLSGGWDSLPSRWNDRITSFRTYAGCEANHYEHSNYGGSQTGYLGSTSNIGEAMNDRTSSIWWH